MINKEQNNQSLQAGDGSTNLQVQHGDIYYNTSAAIVDKYIEEALSLIRRSRYYVEFDYLSKVTNLANSVISGDLKGGSELARCKALAWFLRLSWISEDKDQVQQILSVAKQLEPCEELKIAEAFLTAGQSNDIKTALRQLNVISTPASNSAKLIIYAKQNGHNATIEWFEKTKSKFSDLDSDGKYVLLSQYLNSPESQRALPYCSELSIADFVSTPVLHHAVAMHHLLVAVPGEFQHVVINQLPLDAASFPLRSDLNSLGHLRIAANGFFKAAVEAKALNCQRAVDSFEEYALWINLRDSEFREEARKKLNDLLSDKDRALRYVSLASQFGLSLDIGAINEEIELQIALNGGITQEAAMARFALAFAQNDAEKVADYIEKHFHETAEFIEVSVLRGLQISFLCQAGKFEKANEIFLTLDPNALLQSDRERLQRILSEGKGEDSIELRKRQYLKSGSLQDLQNLIRELNHKGMWSDLATYAHKSFAVTGSIQDAEETVLGMSGSYDFQRIIDFIEENQELLINSDTLKFYLSQALFEVGRFHESLQRLQQFFKDSSNKNVRSLLINGMVATGDWSSISGVIANEFVQRENRSGRENLNNCLLAIKVGSPHARELLRYAASQGTEDAELLASCYFLTTSMGWEDEESFQWLQLAADMSGDSGPIQKMTLQELTEKAPDWNRAQTGVWERLERAEIPLYAAAKSANRSLIEFVLTKAVTNLAQIDPRFKAVIHSFAGNVRNVEFEKISTTIVLDVTSLLTIAHLGILETVIQAFDRILLPHATLIWLFEEKEKVNFHQPSQFKIAHKLQELISKNKIQAVVSTCEVKPDLALEVGDELGVMLSEAISHNQDTQQHIVIKSGPIYRVSSLMEMEADLTGFDKVISSCSALVNKLRDKGQLKQQEAKEALAFLRLHEKEWDDQPNILDGAFLYLDDVALANFMHLSLLDKLCAAGFTISISPRKIEEVNALISYEAFTETVQDHIEYMRAELHKGIKNDKVMFGRSFHDESDGKNVHHPSHQLLKMLGDSKLGSVVIDDRCLNRHNIIGDENSGSTIYTTIDLLQQMSFRNILSVEKLYDCLTHLRQSGHLFVPVISDEIQHYLIEAEIKDEELVETAELRAVRESILKARMGKTLQTPDELAWVHNNYITLITVIKNLWCTEIEASLLSYKLEWVINQINYNNWIHCFRPEVALETAKFLQANMIYLLTIPPENIKGERKKQYVLWLEKCVLQPLKHQAHEIYLKVLEQAKNQVLEIVNN